MDTREAQDIMKRIYFDRDKANGIEMTLLRTSEELRELSDAIMSGKNKEEVSREIADLFAWVCSLANLLDIDLSEALYEKYPNVCSKCGKSPCACPDI